MQLSTRRLSSSGAGRGRLLLYAAPFLLVFGGLLAVAAFYDLRLDAFLTRSALAPGQYYTNQVFGTFFEIVGDSPVELFLAFAIDVIFVWSLRFTRGKKRAALLCVSGVFAAVPGYVLCLICHNRMTPHLLLGTGTAAASGAYLHLTFAFLGLLLDLTGLLAVNSLPDDAIARLIRFAVATVVFASLSTILVNLGLKDLFPRLRFRAMNLRPDDPVYGFDAFARWYEFGKNSFDRETLVTVYGTADAAKSFPSGHTAAAGVSYALIMLSDALRPKRRAVRAALWLIPIAFTGTVAVSRMLVGAHFLSDTLCGGTLSFLLMLAAREVILLRGQNVRTLLGRKAQKARSDQTQKETAAKS